MKIGYRGWAVRRISGLITLCSPNQKYKWAPGENVAEGVSEISHNGFYALKTPEAVFEYFYAGNSRTAIDIVGEVLLYGIVVEGDKGYRAEKAEVGTLLLPTIEKLREELIIEVCARYNVGAAVTSGSTRKVLEMHRNLKAKERLMARYGSRRCTAGGRAIAEIRRDEFLL